jgi:hypothetical protein
MAMSYLLREELRHLLKFLPLLVPQTFLNGGQFFWRLWQELIQPCHAIGTSIPFVFSCYSTYNMVVLSGRVTKELGGGGPTPLPKPQGFPKKKKKF